ncbi:hypothetical protein G2W53_026415 [Senna tora]|uniref:Uncharacterized protein n=1 Tax=Senna tora TaxID=362788 RepID=A0A834THE4_9FABA|nr:hypothetical protein G2W53_026415 [Senna tora]
MDYGAIRGQHRNALLILEEVFRIHRTLNLHQPLKITIKVLQPINFTFFVAILTKSVNPNIKISVIQERTPRILRRKWRHKTVQPSRLCCEILVRFASWVHPIHGVLDFEWISCSVRKQRCIGWDFVHLSAVKVEGKSCFPQFNHLLPNSLQPFLGESGSARSRISSSKTTPRLSSYRAKLLVLYLKDNSPTIARTQSMSFHCNSLCLTQAEEIVSPIASRARRLYLEKASPPTPLSFSYLSSLSSSQAITIAS